MVINFANVNTALKKLCQIKMRKKLVIATSAYLQTEETKTDPRPKVIFLYKKTKKKKKKKKIQNKKMSKKSKKTNRPFKAVEGFLNKCIIQADQLL